MANSHRFAEKIKELERQGKQLLGADVNEWDSGSALFTDPLADSGRLSLSGTARQIIRDDDLMNKARVESSLSRSVPVQSSRAEPAPVRTPTVQTLFSHTALSPSHEYTFTPLSKPSAISLPRLSSLSQSLSIPHSPKTATERLLAEKEIRQANVAIDGMREQVRQAHKSTEEHKKHFRASTEELTRRLHDTLLERDRLAAGRVAEVSSQEELIHRLQQAVTELHRTTDSQKQTIQDTDRQLHILELVKSDHNNMMDLLRTVLKNSERRRGRSYYESESVDRQSSAMLVHSLERCIEEGESERERLSTRVVELERQVSDSRIASCDIERTTAKAAEERFERIREDLESKLSAADERAVNSRSQSESLKQQLEIIQEQYRGSELLREEQNRMLEERVELLKSQLDGERKDSHSKLESVSVALDSTNRDLTTTLSTRDEMVRRFAGLEEKVKDQEVTIEKLNAELDMEKEQSKRLWEKDNEILNRNVEIETKMALRDAEMARLEAMLEKTKDECSKQITQEVDLAEKYQQDKFSEEKSILVKQVDSLTERHNKASKELQDVQVENGKLKSQLKHVLDKLSNLERNHLDATDDKHSLQSQLIAKNEQIDKVTKEKDQYVNMLEQRNNQFNEISLACERANIQREERERHMTSLESTVRKLEERLSQAHHEINNYHQENATLHKTRDEFDARIREMEVAVDKQTKKLRSKDKKIADADSERGRLDELLAHKSDTAQQLEDQLRSADHDLKDARREASILHEECRALKSVIKGQEGEMQREINNLLLKMKAVEHDYKLAKKALKSKDHVDKQASGMANKLQVELTEQRKYSDDLRTKLRWMEDCLEAAKKDKLGVADQCEQLQAELEHRCQAEQRLQQIVMTERSKASMLQSKVVSLEDGLKETISRCTGLQTSAEKSEQDLYKLKLKHQLELKEMQRSGETNPQITVTHPVCSPLKQQQDDGLAMELKTVLSDMKSLLSTAQERKVYERQKSPSNRRSVSGTSEVSTFSQSDGAGIERLKSDYSSRRLHRKSAGSVDSLLKPADLTSDRGSYRTRDRKHRKVSEPLRSEAQVGIQTGKLREM